MKHMNKWIHKIFSLVLLLGLSIMMAACSKVACESVTIDAETEIFRVGSTVQFTAELSPVDTTEKIKWSSKDTSVASIDKNGLATLIAEGETVIKATCGAVSDQWMITVVRIDPESIEVSLPTLIPGNSYELKATVYPLDADQSVSWKVEGDNASITNDGVLTVSEYGTFTLTATSVADETIFYKKEIVVAESAPDAITIVLDHLTYEVGETITPQISTSPEGSSPAVTWTVSSSSIASVSSEGTITFLAAGVVTIYAYSKKDANVMTSITVSVVLPLPTAITVTSERETVKVTQTSHLKATVLPAKANDAVTWSSSDESVATISAKGLATFLSTGTVTFTAKSKVASVISGSITLTVESAPADPTVSYEDGLTKGATKAEILTAVIAFINEHYNDQNITGDVDFITSYKGSTDIDFSWTSGNTDILTNDGVYKQPIIDTDVSVSAVMLTKDESNSYISRSVIVTMHAAGWGTVLDALTYTIGDALPNKTTSNITLPTTDEKTGATITWESSNEDVISSTGTFTKPISDTAVTLTYTVTLSGESKSASVVVTAVGYTDYQIAMLILNDFNNYYNENVNGQLIAGDVYLSTETDIYPATITWTSSNPGIINSNGVYTKPVYATKIQLTVSIMVGSSTVSASYDISVSKTSYTDKWDAIEMFLNNIAVKTVTNQQYTAYGWESGYQFMTQTDYGHLYFYDEAEPNIIKDFLSVGGNRPGVKRNSTEFVTVHDTASGTPTANASAMNAYVHSEECVNGSKSWIFSVGNDGIYQEMPDDEISYHAGDGGGIGSEFTLIDTGIKATHNDPKVTIQDGYWVLDGRITKIKAPTNGSTVLTTSHIIDSGIFTKIGANGHWYIANTWYSPSYGFIANHGGNRNSVSIETCVNDGSDYTLTMEKTAKLVAWLLLKYGLDTSRVVQHNYWSGKDCSMTMRHSGRWSMFLNMVNLEYFAQSELSDVKFTWKSLTPNVLSDTGKIINHAGAGAEVNYQCTVTYNGVTKTYQFTSKLARLSF